MRRSPGSAPPRCSSTSTCRGSPGTETLDFIRAADPDVPVIAVTAESDPVAAVDLVDRGADDFLQKPVDRGRLVRALLAHARTARTVVAA